MSIAKIMTNCLFFKDILSNICYARRNQQVANNSVDIRTSLVASPSSLEKRNTA